MKNPHRRDNNVEELKRLKSLYGRLWLISLQINERFNWFICAMITVYFCTLSAGFYWVLMRIMFKRWKTVWRKIRPYLHTSISLRTINKDKSIFISEANLVHVPLPISVIVLVQELEGWRSVSKNIAQSIFVTKNFSSALGRTVIGIRKLQSKETLEIIASCFRISRCGKSHTPFVYANFDSLL